ncbi:MIP/aquaporin family protein [Bifidobacterium sp. ESL0745]|uniref:MIP/aquaporin family protein n=1 Tax=Bifidobacterium sp. ESL0745 TaxID=2983226 RepID=UPI0023F66A9D|nr:MIP/aquaporin family protein [Bifidobacterium sp. ESL0745]MDF7664647.1 aquaporin family protein [Bifidobacterium sp. ESL0745]
MQFTLFEKLAAEFLGTMILLILGNGSVANTNLKKTKGYASGWLNIALGYGLGVMVPVIMFGSVSGAHLNPAMSLGQAISGFFPWSEVLPYAIAQMLGAFVGQLVVYIIYQPHYKIETDPDLIFGSFCTFDATGNKVNYFVTEFIATAVMAFASVACMQLPWGKKYPATAGIVLGLIITSMVTSMGGSTGAALNPARDLMPRLLHQILPIPNKGSSRWGDAWIPVVAPILGATFGIGILKVCFFL